MSLIILLFLGHNTGTWTPSKLSEVSKTQILA